MFYSNIKFKRGKVTIVDGLLGKMVMEVHHEWFVSGPDRSHGKTRPVSRLKFRYVRTEMFSMRSVNYSIAIDRFELISCCGHKPSHPCWAFQALGFDFAGRGTYAQIGRASC